MLKQLLSLYPNAIIQDSKPRDFNQPIHWFQDKANKYWLGIPKNDLSESHLQLLKILFPYKAMQVNFSNAAQQWYEFLFSNGDIPSFSSETEVRAIQFSFSPTTIDQNDFEQALKGFFPHAQTICWESNSSGIIIEQYHSKPIQQEDLLYINKTIESDFFITLKIYIGVFHPLNDYFPTQVANEKNYFQAGKKLLQTEEVFTFERVFPLLVISQMPSSLKQILEKQLLAHIKDDEQLLSTAKVFLDHQLNASLTAKKLYIHRNTLQYRLDKFTEKTGISLKNSHGAVTVYLAYLLKDFHS